MSELANMPHWTKGDVSSWGHNVWLRCDGLVVRPSTFAAQRGTQLAWHCETPWATVSDLWFVGLSLAHALHDFDKLYPLPDWQKPVPANTAPPTKLF